MKTIYFPEHITSLACSDFDETYFAHQHSHPEDVKALESFIAQYAHKGYFLESSLQVRKK